MANPADPANDNLKFRSGYPVIPLVQKDKLHGKTPVEPERPLDALRAAQKRGIRIGAPLPPIAVKSIEPI